MEQKNNWGGLRQNAGRKPKPPKEKYVTVAFSCTQEQKEKLRQEVTESGLSQSAYICKKLF
jgi:hypothetical protein